MATETKTISDALRGWLEENNLQEEYTNHTSLTSMSVEPEEIPVNLTEGEMVQRVKEEMLTLGIIELAQQIKPHIDFEILSNPTRHESGFVVESEKVSQVFSFVTKNPNARERERLGHSFLSFSITVFSTSFTNVSVRIGQIKFTEEEFQAIPQEELVGRIGHAYIKRPYPETPLLTT